MTDRDLLEGADIGETRTITETRELWVRDLEAEACRGTDRLADSEIVDVEQTTDEYGDAVLAVTVESDVTKRLPYDWDSANQPRTDRERTQARRRKWARRGVRAVSTLIPLGVGLVVADTVMAELAGKIVVGGEPIPEPSMIPVVVILLLGVAIVYMIQHLPRPGPGVGR